jgi:hypothetical protein
MNRSIARLAILAGGVGAALAVAAFASAVTTYTSYPVVVSCTSTGQVCDPAFQKTATTASQLDLEFTSDSQSCASFSVDFLVDGAVVFSSAVLGPGASTGTFVAGPVTAGGHTVAARATGVTGGCDDGTLHSWSGRLTVSTNDDPTPTPTPTPPPDPQPAPGTGPTSILQCMWGGWQDFSDLGFKNQGDCVSYVVTGGRNGPAPRSLPRWHFGWPWGRDDHDTRHRGMVTGGA